MLKVPLSYVCVAFVPSMLFVMVIVGVLSATSPLSVKALFFAASSMVKVALLLSVLITPLAVEVPPKLSVYAQVGFTSN